MGVSKGTILRTPFWGLVPAMGVTVWHSALEPPIQLYVDIAMFYRFPRISGTFAATFDPTVDLIHI